VTIRGRPHALRNLPASSKRGFLLRSDDNLASHSLGHRTQGLTFQRAQNFLSAIKFNWHPSGVRTWRSRRERMPN
jgi:hypothetical protein